MQDVYGVEDADGGARDVGVDDAGDGVGGTDGATETDGGLDGGERDVDAGDGEVDGGGDVDSCPGPESVESVDCSEPRTCPEADATKSPEITCHEPRAVRAGEDVEVHLYGRYLLDENGAARFVEVRDKSDPAATERKTSRIDIVSRCHLRATLPVGEADWFACGKVLEVSLLRSLPDSPDGDVKQTDWYEVRVVRGNQDSE